MAINLGNTAQSILKMLLVEAVATATPELAELQAGHAVPITGPFISIEGQEYRLALMK